jgi:cytochrome oxidase Cu insertion factor (SCO1/SenC/PrrC family)
MRARHVLAAAFIVLIATAPAPAQLGPKDGVGLIASELDRVKVAQPAPDFTLEDADGKPITLADFRDKKSVVLVFYRGYW